MYCLTELRDKRPGPNVQSPGIISAKAMPPTNQSFSFQWVNPSPVIFWLVPAILLEFLRKWTGNMKMPEFEVTLRGSNALLWHPGSRYPFHCLP
jgi:hypothetical protein